MVTCADVCSSIFGLVKAVNNQVERLDSLREEARKLYRYVKRVEVLVSDLQPYISSSEEPELVSALQGIDGDLKNIWRLLEDCCTKGRVSSYLQADRTLYKFHQATAQLERSVQGLAASVAEVSVAEETAEEVQGLRAMLQRAKYDLPAEHQRLLSEFRNSCDQLKEPFETMKEACFEILKTVCDDPHLTKEGYSTVINDLQKEVHYVQSTGNHEDMFYIRMLMDMIRVNHIQTDAPLDYICPITHNVMVDPVILHETGHSYERSAIQDWYAKGHHFCPRSGIQLKRLNVTSNHNLKDAISRWSLHNDYQLQFRPVLSTLMSSHEAPVPDQAHDVKNGYEAAGGTSRLSLSSKGEIVGLSSQSSVSSTAADKIIATTTVSAHAPAPLSFGTVNETEKKPALHNSNLNGSPPPDSPEVLDVSIRADMQSQGCSEKDEYTEKEAEEMVVRTGTGDKAKQHSFATDITEENGEEPTLEALLRQKVACTIDSYSRFELNEQ